jgi:hypothetical protein
VVYLEMDRFTSRKRRAEESEPEPAPAA